MNSIQRGYWRKIKVILIYKFCNQKLKCLWMGWASCSHLVWCSKTSQKYLFLRWYWGAGGSRSYAKMDAFNYRVSKLWWTFSSQNTSIFIICRQFAHCCIPVITYTSKNPFKWKWPHSSWFRRRAPWKLNLRRNKYIIKTNPHPKTKQTKKDKENLCTVSPT